MNKFWDNMNRGVSANPLPGPGRWWLTSTQRQWKDIRHKYVAQEEDDE